MVFNGFSTVGLQTADGTGFVYILCWMAGDTPTPFYVGQTQSIWGRLNDYYWADFQAATDFRVGEAVRYLDERGLRVVANYKKCVNRKDEERRIVEELHAEGRQLLNDCRAYDYRSASAPAERARVRAFIDKLLAAEPPAASQTTA